MHTPSPGAHACTKITFEIDSNRLDGYTDEYLVQLWHISQANPAPFGDRQACELTERIGREIIRRYVSNQPPALWNHQGRHVLTQVRIAAEYAAPSVADIIERLQAQVQPGEVITLDEATSLLNLPDEPGMQGRLTTALSCAGFTRGRFGDLRLWAWKAPAGPLRPESPGELPAAPSTHQQQPGACDQCSHPSAAPIPEAQQQPDSSLAQKEPHQSAWPSLPPMQVGGSVSSAQGGDA